MKTRTFLLSVVIYFVAATSIAAPLPNRGSEGDNGLTECQAVQSDRGRTPLQRTDKVGGGASADSAYTHEHYAEAAVLYRQLVDSLGESAQLYFNLGNCYYRQDSIARAILYYERARLLDPSDDDIRFNLDMARAKTVDRVVPASEMFFVSLYRQLVLSMSIQGWAVLAVVMFVLMLLAFAAYLFAPVLWAKKTGFTVAILALLVCVFANVAAVRQRHHIEHRTSAVIMAPSAVVKSTPSNSGTDLFILHEGTYVRLVDDTMRDWVEIHMTDGKQGWLPRTSLEVI